MTFALPPPPPPRGSDLLVCAKRALCAIGLFSCATLSHAQQIPDISCSTNPAIFNTGINGANGYSNSSPTLPTGSTDVHWEYSISSTSYPSIPSPAIDFNSLTWTDATVNKLAGAWFTSPFGNAQWIGEGVGPGTVFYRYQFTLDSAVNPSSFNVAFDFYVDDQVRQIYINGNPIYGAGTQIGGFASATYVAAILNQYWQPGANEIVIQTVNITSPSGLLIQSTDSASCSGPLQVSKTTTINSAVASGGSIPYTLTVTNNSTNAINGVTLTDTLPAGLTASGTWACTAPGGSAATCPAASGALPLNVTLDLPASSQLQFTFNATVAAGAPALITNTATLTPPPGSPASLCIDGNGNDSCTASTGVSSAPLLNIAKTALSSGPIAEGGTVTYQITVSNPGSVAVAGVAVSDALPAGLTNGQWTCSVPASSFAVCPAGSSTPQAIAGGGALGAADIPANSSLVYTVTATVDNSVEAGQISAVNAATATPTTTGTQCVNASGVSTGAAPCSTQAPPIVLAAPELNIVKTALSRGPIAEGGTATYQITVSNPGVVTAAGVTVTESLPTGLTNGQWTCSAPAGSAAACPAGSSSPQAIAGDGTLGAAQDIPAGSSLVYTVTATVDSSVATGQISAVNAVSATSTSPGTQCVDASGTPTGSQPCNTQAPPVVLAPNIPVPTNAGWALALLSLLVAGVAAAAGWRHSRRRGQNVFD